MQLFGACWLVSRGDVLSVRDACLEVKAETTEETPYVVTCGVHKHIHVTFLVEYILTKKITQTDFLIEDSLSEENNLLQG